LKYQPPEKAIPLVSEAIALMATFISPVVNEFRFLQELL
jgi:hypothetical protein